MDHSETGGLTAEEASWVLRGFPIEESEQYGFHRHLAASGMMARYEYHINPHHCERELVKTAREIVSKMPLLVETVPQLDYRSNIYVVNDMTGQKTLEKKWWQLQEIARSVGGFEGFGENIELPHSAEAMRELEKGLFLLSAECAFKAFAHWPFPVYFRTRGQRVALRIR